MKKLLRSTLLILETSVIELSNKAKNYFGEIRPILLLVVMVPYAIMLAFITSVGGVLQQSVFALVSSEPPSLYAAVYQDNITRWPSLPEWMLGGLSWPWLLCGALISAVAVPQRRVGKILLATAVSGSFALSLTDLLVGGPAAPVQAQNFVGNLLGGALVALVAFPGLLLFVGIAGNRSLSSAMRLGMGGGVLVAFGAAICVISFLLFKFLFHPVSQKMDVVISPPTSGMSYGSVSWDGTKKDNRFSFLPESNIGGELYLTSMDGRTTVEWRSLHNQRYTVTATLILDCGFSQIQTLPTAPTFLEEKGVSRVVARFDGQMSFIRTSSDPSASYIYRPTWPTQYWIDGKDEGRLNITHFTSPEDQIEAMISSSTSVIISGAMLRNKDGLSFPEERSLSLDFGSKKVTINFPKPRVDQADRALKCHAWKPRFIDGTFHSKEGAMVGGIMLRFVREAPPSFYSRQDATLRISGASGSFAVRKVSIDSLTRGALGKTGFLSFGGAIQSFRLDGVDAPHRAHDRFLAIGDLEVSWLVDGNLHIVGSVGQLWRGSQRMNPTAWERISMEVRLALLTLLVGMGGVLEFCRRRFLKTRRTDLVGLIT